MSEFRVGCVLKYDSSNASGRENVDADYLGSGAYVGFCAPLASHANAIQAYRASLNKYSLSPPNTLYKVSATD